MLQLTDLNSRMCKWPVGEDDGTHLFCGCEKPAERPYCDAHQKKSRSPRPAWGLAKKPEKQIVAFAHRRDRIERCSPERGEIVEQPTDHAMATANEIPADAFGESAYV